MNQNLSELVNSLEKIKRNRQFKNYINFIQFPFYRNIDLDTRINFSFPLTVFVGPNGCGKSSCLHALYGAPANRSTSYFWFNTKVDPITYYNDQKKRHSFWYSYKDEKNQTKEVIKARIKRNNDPNYWETSRPLVWAGMKKQISRNDRDKPINKDVVYIDFRSELSAFDKYFYFGNVKGIKSKNKQEFIQKKSFFLKKVLAGEIESFSTKAGYTNKPLRLLSKIELEWISFILGKIYLSGYFLEHSFFRNEGYSVLFKTSYAEYSEAFAGSGEVAIVKLVIRILDAKNYSLILLDEPEVSLHPGAQSRLKIFLLSQIKIKKHQIIITSHFPSIIKGLPREAIKTFYQNPNTGRFLIKEDLTSEQAFYHIEFPIENRQNIIVEDLLAQEIIVNVLDSMGDEVKNLFNVKFNPGGESVIKREFISIFCREYRSKNFVFFDGDQKPFKPHFDWRSLSSSEISIESLHRSIIEQTKEKISFSVDGGNQGGNKEQYLEIQKQYLDYYLSNVFYLPKLIPEDIIWDLSKADKLLEITVLDETLKSEAYDKLITLHPTKEKFSFLSKILYGSNRADDLKSIHKLFIQYWLQEKNADYFDIKSSLDNITRCM